MDQLFTMSLHTHTLTVILLILSQIGFFWIKKEPDFILFVRKVKTLYLVQTILYAMVVFTGLLMMAVTKFELWSIKVVLMIFLALVILVHQILLYKRLRPIRSDEKSLQEEYKRWASKVFGAEIAAELALFVMAFLLG
ncbi:MAG: hypothetical protein C6H99_02025 [Epsilonproteobacteria bacterium]|nr:hypothetical protein [Campylobacterota bacterium]NPA63860.1 hypothetical protein [Campylobacterota bacterium]